MRKLLCVSLLAVLSGCAQFGQEESVDDVASSTTTVDAVEGDKNSSSGIVDTLRGRTDPVADDPAWAPIHPKNKPEHYAAATGSLFNTHYARNWYDDSKPRGIGDIITVELNEATKAQKVLTLTCQKPTILRWIRCLLAVDRLPLMTTISPMS